MAKLRHDHREPNNRHAFGVSRAVFLLGLVSLFTDISSEMLYPIIPIFLTEVLLAPVAVVGIIEGVAESTSRLLQVFSGWLSDRWPRRRPIVLFGYSLSATAKPLLALAFGWPLVLFARFVDRFGKGMRNPPRDALIADSSPEDARGRAFGFHRSMDTIGAVIGPLVALVFLALLGNRYRLLFLLAFIPALIGIMPLLFVREGKRSRSRSELPGMTHSVKSLGRPFYLFILVTVVFAIGNSSDVFLLIRARTLGFTPVNVVFFFVLYNVVYALISLPAGIVSDRLGRRFVMVLGLLIFAAVYVGFALTGSPTDLWLLFPAYGFYIAMTEGIGKAWVADLVPKEKIGTAMGVYQMTTGFANLIASTAAGLLWTFVSVPAPFYLGAGAALGAALLFLLFFRR